MTFDEFKEQYELRRLPGHMWEGVYRYLNNGIMTGSFLTAIMEDKLVRSFGAADDINTLFMREWVMWLYDMCPLEARGSAEKVAAWKASGGFEGRTK